MTELEELKLAYEECSRQRNELLNKLKAQQEPVAWMDGYRNIYSLEEKAAGCEDAVIPLYTSPPAQRKPLTDEEIVKITADPCLYIRGGDYRIDIARAIEAAHGIKE